MGVAEVGKAKVIPIEWLRALRTAQPAPPVPDRPAAAVPSDRVIEELKSSLEDLPDVRTDKVIEAKLRISTGYYDRPEVRREILRSVLQAFLPDHAPEEADGEQQS